MNLSTAGACLRFLLLLLLLSPALSVYVGPALKSQWQDPYRGRDHVFHMQLEVSGIELDHLLLSSNYTQMDLYVLFYVPSNPLAKTLLPVWKQVWERFAPIPRVDVLQVDCSGVGGISCKDRNVVDIPSIQRFPAGSPHGFFYRGSVDLFALEEWIIDASNLEKEMKPRDVQPVSGCVAFRQTSGCDPEGGREPHKDKPCDHEVTTMAGAMHESHPPPPRQIPSGMSGYCECGEGDHRMKVRCRHQPFRCDEVCVKVPGCVAWRQTGSCVPDGPREPQNDKHCRRALMAGVSGYCECEGGRKVALVRE
ncbi:hypothetical protein GUITHDRAFT_162385 [Guillardia theta CCMP2712]|uniref:Thioredoxin domain-containing protein n=1 Tax=Guillardia theta (strain CCMP2712) TaxID=905079 RepID=L1JJ10_GUITC|nr:hypothetical protein GUITHDRAFT_162385 [Guillardia theta CCMP2712]EKX48513.1 hypothetical protein GUITHDRAFT_162385 [Guillardia theta CCMP2712]|eukprot:XP_005835493.1 hypothetical protein GUITHDRAFT_162385 [Guillardia theta CCMP2712]